MFDEKFLEVISHEGVVAIVSGNGSDPHVVNTWNTYLTVTDDDKLLIPAAGMKSIQQDVELNNRIQITLGSKEVQGLRFMGAGFYISGTASFLDAGSEYEMMKQKFPFLSRVLKISVSSIKQTI